MLNRGRLYSCPLRAETRGQAQIPARAPKRSVLSGSAHREGIDPQRGLPHTDRDTLAVLATGTNTIVELQVVAHHAHPGEYIRAIADERRALERRAEPAVLDGIGLACREHELAGGDVNLPAAEVDSIDAALDG